MFHNLDKNSITFLFALDLLGLLDDLEEIPCLRGGCARLDIVMLLQFDTILLEHSWKVEETIHHALKCIGQKTSIVPDTCMDSLLGLGHGQNQFPC